MKATKPRIQGKIAHLPPEQVERLHELFRQNLTYEAIRKRLQTEFGVSTSRAALCNYYQKRARDFIPGEKGKFTLPNGSPASIAVHVHLHFDKREEAVST